MDFIADFQDFITRYAWGEIWTRTGLDRRTRSCITRTARVALPKGLSEDEVKEVLLQSAIFAQRVFADHDQRPEAKGDAPE
jgi:3-oxoadipate enol-lactonase / 4-carboxymuconolactone decarboxylase